MYNRCFFHLTCYEELELTQLNFAICILVYLLRNLNDFFATRMLTHSSQNVSELLNLNYSSLGEEVECYSHWVCFFCDRVHSLNLNY